MEESEIRLTSAPFACASAPGEAAPETCRPAYQQEAGDLGALLCLLHFFCAADQKVVSALCLLVARCCCNSWSCRWEKQSNQNQTA